MNIQSAYTFSEHLYLLLLLLSNFTLKYDFYIIYRTALINLKQFNNRPSIPITIRNTWSSYSHPALAPIGSASGASVGAHHGGAGSTGHYHTFAPAVWSARRRPTPVIYSQRDAKQRGYF